MNASTMVSGAGQEVEFSSIPRELKKLWATNKAMTRASAMNFAIYSERAGSLEENTELIREVTREHACRALLIVFQHGEREPMVRAWITAHCQLAPGGGKSVCSEQVTFAITGEGGGLVTNTLFANVDSDLPLTLWWQGGFSPRWEPHLFTEIDRLVIDSSQWADPSREFKVLEEAWRHAGSAFSVNDLTWTRVLHLRMALAACFDEPAALALLPRMNEIIITHARGHALAARMFAAWMMHRAGWWLAAGGSGAGFALNANDGERRTLRFAEAEGCPVSHVAMRAAEGSITVSREPGSPFIAGRTCIGDLCSNRLTPCPCDSPAELVVERLRRGCHTQLYFTLLETARELLR